MVIMHMQPTGRSLTRRAQSDDRRPNIPRAQPLRSQDFGREEATKSGKFARGSSASPVLASLVSVHRPRNSLRRRRVSGVRLRWRSSPTGASRARRAPGSRHSRCGGLRAAAIGPPRLRVAGNSPILARKGEALEPGSFFLLLVVAGANFRSRFRWNSERAGCWGRGII